MLMLLDATLLPTLLPLLLLLFISISSNSSGTVISIIVPAGHHSTAPNSTVNSEHCAARARARVIARIDFFDLGI